MFPSFTPFPPTTNYSLDVVNWLYDCWLPIPTSYRRGFFHPQHYNSIRCSSLGTKIEFHCFRIGKSKYQLWRNYTNNGAVQYGGGWYPTSTTTCFIFMFVTTQPVWIIVLKENAKKREKRFLAHRRNSYVWLWLTGMSPERSSRNYTVPPVQYRCDAGSHDHRRTNKRVWIVGLKF